jgi:hypothetical protein
MVKNRRSGKTPALRYGDSGQVVDPTNGPRALQRVSSTSSVS